MPDLVVAGGGAAGFMAAITAAEAGLKQVQIWEATAEPLALSNLVTLENRGNSQPAH